ncbi:MAG: AI-2E family transporter [Phycisphaerales bacterium]|jgi:AI-2 transport protein TqsA|nr:AI-2E family transporter [Phycisphaerales bacterium]
MKKTESKANYQHRVQTTCLVILSTIGVAVALRWLAPVLVPFVLAIFITLGMSLLIDLQMKHLHIPRLAALAITIVVGLAIMAVLGLLVIASVNQLVANTDTYQAQIKSVLDSLASAVPLESFGFDPDTDSSLLAQIPNTAIQKMLVDTGTAIMGIVSQGVLVLIFVIFLLSGQLLNHKSTVGGMLGEAEAGIKVYIATKVMVSVITGVLVGLTLTLLGVEMALMFGLFAFLLNFVPSVGSVISTLLPLPVVMVSPNLSPTVAVLAIVIPGAIQFAVGNVVEPKIMGKSLDLHPVVILMGLIFWGMLWGIVGMLLATPMTAVVKIFLSKREFTAPMARILSGRLDVIDDA